MNTIKEMSDLLEQLKVQFALAKSKAAFLSLKRDEFRYCHYLSATGCMAAEQDLMIETSNLAACFHRVADKLHADGSFQGYATAPLLNDVQNFLRVHFSN